MINKEIEKILANHEERLKTLERLPQENIVEIINQKTKKSDNFSGPKGGVLLLISHKFFDAKKNAEEVNIALDDEGYVYKKQVIQNTLNRLSAKKGPLVLIENGGKRLYVKRK